MEHRHRRRSVVSCFGIAPRSAPNSSKTRRKTEPPEYPLWLLKRAFHYGHRSVNDAIRSFGVTPTQMGALNRLVQEPGLSGAELARRLLVTPQAAQLAIAALEERGLVERRADANHGRIVRTYLTHEGRQVVRDCMVPALQAEDEFLSVLTPDEVETLVDLLGRLAKQ
jgi:DNA-binding MarR family transcriptional regulator